MNQIVIFEPRWHDRVVLIAEHRLADDNEIVIDNKNFPHPYYITRQRVMSFPQQLVPSKAGKQIPMRQVPIIELEKEVIDL